MAGHELLAQWVAQQGLKKQAVANRLNVSPGQFGRWLSGAVTPQLSHRMAIENLTGGVVKATGWHK